MSNLRFLLPALQIVSILSQTNKRQIKEALKKLPSRLIDNLDLTLDRIQSQDLEDSPRTDLALKTLMWLSTAKKPLKIEELRHAVATVPGWNELDALADPVSFTESCLGLVTIDAETAVVRFVHFTVSEYLEARRLKLFPVAEAQLAASCLAYLLRDCTNTRLPLTGDEFNQLSRDSPFLDYATSYWGVHAVTCYQDEVRSLTAEFISKPIKLDCWTQRFEFDPSKRTNWSGTLETPPRVSGTSELHVAARLGLQELVQELLNNPESNPNPRDYQNRTPLMFAAQQRHRGILMDLLSHPRIDVNATTNEGKTALGYAVESRHLECVRALVSAGADVNLGAPLHQAAEGYLDFDRPPTQKRDGIAEFLLSCPELDVNVVDGRGSSAWYSIATQGDVVALELLLSRADFDPSGTDLSTDLSNLYNYTLNSDWMTETAIVDGVVRLLTMLDQDSRFPFEDFNILRNLWGPLYYAFSDCEPDKETGGELSFTESGFNIFDTSGGTLRPKVRNLLRDQGYSLAIKDSKDRTLLHLMASDEFHAEEKRSIFCDFLLQQGLDVNCRDKLGRTPLHYAANTGNMDVVELLIGAGALLDSADAKGYTILHDAVDGGSIDAVVLLLLLRWSIEQPDMDMESGQDTTTTPSSFIDATDQDDCTALHLAVFNENMELAELLLDHGANPNAISITGPTIHYTQMNMNLNLEKLLVDRGADLDLLDCYGKSAWDRIAEDEDTVKFLGLSLGDYTPSDPIVSRRHVINCLIQRLKLALSLGEKERQDCLFRPGQQLLCLGDELNAAIAFKYLIDKDDEFHYRCCTKPLCGQVKLPFFVCRSCPWVDICSKCMANPDRERPGLPFCRGHEFFRVGGEGWEARFETGVAIDGQSMEEWLEATLKRYEREVVDLDVHG
jgi:ankyrin repeat protein